MIPNKLLFLEGSTGEGQESGRLAALSVGAGEGALVGQWPLVVRW